MPSNIEVPQPAPMPSNIEVPQPAPMPMNAEMPQLNQESQNEVKGEDLVKDKKGTKMFLIFLFVLVVVFIICLPFLTKFINNMG